MEESSSKPPKGGWLPQTRTSRILWIILILCMNYWVISAWLGPYWIEPFVYWLLEWVPILTVFVVVVFFLAGVGSKVLEFLQGKNLSADADQIGLRVEELREMVSSGAAPTVDLTETERENLVGEIRARIGVEASETFLDELRHSVQRVDGRDNATRVFKEAKKRLDLEVAALGRRGNLNLVLGIMTTIAGLSVMAFAVATGGAVPEDDWLLRHFLPRFSLAAFIELFAYFFLNLYRQSLAEIKYFQNEITNIEAKYISLEIACSEDDPELRRRVVELLAQTERNFVLEKGQTTTELEKRRIEGESMASLAGVVEKLVPALKN
ncbi:MAG: hypothetical protein GY906_11425 [bacterium]|nr:hypothetical protein [bacterium]